MEKIRSIPKEENILLLLFLNIVTLGIYSFFWYFKKRIEFENLNTQKKLEERVIIIYLILLISNIFYQSFSFIFTELRENYYSLITSYILLILLLVILITLSFNSRTIINQAWKNKGVNKEVSFFFTLIFNFFYLQYEINRTIRDKEEEERVGPWISLILILLIIFLIIIIALISSNAKISGYPFF
jgi:tryptophan-rich sensory protein